MKHVSTRDLFAYWNERRGTRPAPERGEIEPGAIRHVLGDAFILGAEPSAGHPVRLAGTRLCALFCRELKGEAFDHLWTPASRSALRAALAVVTNEMTGMVAGVTGHTADGSALDLELLVLPLAYRRPHHARMIGVLSPAMVPYWLGEYPLTALALGSHRHLGPAAATLGAQLPNVPPNARAKRGFFVYDGGRS